ncbi:hypothetical protein SAMN05720781_2057 [Fibrobacter sp. UWT3]|nr:hypothetical protein SAMN05720781_2057 [Fibrobacter sp. UWT3]
MFDLKSFFDGMSKPLLRDVHARAYGKKGLLNNALIQSEVLTYFSDRDRVAKLFAHMEPWQKRCLNLVYHSASRGLTYNELRLTVPVAKNKELRTFLLQMCREFLLWRSQASGVAVYHGFTDFAHSFEIEPQGAPESSKPYQEYGSLLAWHICLVLSLAKRGELRVNTNGTLNRRSYQMCIDAFTASGKVSAKASENELTLIFSFLTQREWLEQENSFLYPSEAAYEFLRTSGFRLHQYVLTWWLEVRFRNDALHLKRLLRCVAEPRCVCDAAYLFWVMDPSCRILESNRHLAWEYLPRPMRELWLIGLLKFQFESGKVSAIAVSEVGREWMANSVLPQNEGQVSMLPNFDLVVSASMSPQLLFTVACLAKVKNDEAFLCFNFEKETYIAGLKSDIPESDMEQLIAWIKPPENVLSTFREWNASFYGAKVRTVRLLKIDDLKILGELTRFPQFMECVEEYIPGYGFVLDQKKEPAALNILESFGYCPFADRSAKKRDRAPTDEWRKEFAIAWPAEGNVDYELKDDVDEATVQSALDSTKYGSVYQKLDSFDLVKVLRYAKLTGTYLAAKVKDPAKRADKVRELVFTVHALHLAKAPLNVEIQEKGAEAGMPLQLSFIQEIKVMQKIA